MGLIQINGVSTPIARTKQTPHPNSLYCTVYVDRTNKTIFVSVHEKVPLFFNKVEKHEVTTSQYY